MTTIIWRFSDGKAGHDNQSRGLVNALAERLPVTEHVIQVGGNHKAFWWWLTRRYSPGAALPAPDLLVGAGHATHPHLLAARRRYGGRSVVLMKPSLPRAWFDLCIVPRHDQVAPADNVIITQGVLNTIRPGGIHDDDTGLIAIGGPSRHFLWDNEAILKQVEQLLQQRPKERWWLTTSRRTPAALAERLQRQTKVQYVHVDETGPDWLAARLAEAGEVWVSQDSLSMIYETLSSGARIGLLAVPGKGGNRISAAIDQLAEEGWVGTPGQWQPAPVPGQPLNEASRCADWMVQQWLNAV
jgi:mitochondrial fission protein ELM1